MKTTKSKTKKKNMRTQRRKRKKDNQIEEEDHVKLKTEKHMKEAPGKLKTTSGKN